MMEWCSRFDGLNGPIMLLGLMNMSIVISLFLHKDIQATFEQVLKVDQEKKMTGWSDWSHNFVEQVVDIKNITTFT